MVISLVKNSLKYEKIAFDVLSFTQVGAIYSIPFIEIRVEMLVIDGLQERDD
jgi:hypothetical protein